MAHKITQLFKKPNSFPNRNEDLSEIFAKINERLESLEKTVKELKKKEK